MIFLCVFLSVALQHIEERTCVVCNKLFSRKEHFKRHWMEQHMDKNTDMFECKKCGRNFKRRYHLARHDRICTNSLTKYQKLMCSSCNIFFEHEEELMSHCNTHHYLQLSW